MSEMMPLMTKTDQALTGSLSGLYKFRVGDYRIIYALLPDKDSLNIHQVGHHKDIYK